MSSLEKETKKNIERIKSLEQATKENTERITSLERATKENTQSIDNLSEKIENNKLGIMDTFDRMEKSISKRFDDLDEKINKIYEANVNNDAEHMEFKKILGILGANDLEAANRIEKLEEWKNSIDGSLFAV